LSSNFDFHHGINDGIVLPSIDGSCLGSVHKTSEWEPKNITCVRDYCSNVNMCSSNGNKAHFNEVSGPFLPS
jgi:hypothetical protein